MVLLKRPSLLLALVLSGGRGVCGEGHPLVLIPGITGTGLLAKLSEESEYFSCRNQWEVETQDDRDDPPVLGGEVSVLGKGPVGVEVGQWYRTWLTLDTFRPPESHQECWYKVMGLRYQKPLMKWHSLGTWVDPPGVETRVDDGLHGVDYLDYLAGYGLSPTRYYHDLINGVLAAFPHYQKNVNFTAFGYDWRLPPWQLDWNSLTKHIEDLHSRQGKPVVLISHSMGSLWLNYYLNTYTTTRWKRQHIRALISINGANGGSFKTLRALISGYSPITFSWFDYLKIPQLISLPKVRTLCQTYPALFSLLPNDVIYGPDSHVVTYKDSHGTQQRYTLQNWTDTLPSNELKDQIESVKTTLGNVGLQDPEVEYYCLYSIQNEQSTEFRYSYDTGTFDKDPSIQYTWGDGTIAAPSLTYCRAWDSTRMVKVFKGIDHMFALRDSAVISSVVNILSNL
ncbi:lecithin:cholesterol acyltransferase [Gregarina niphandrodes]|uniref:Lecithin:cholesterol acyltransferase n=1 Tax=Gregarina niphandrodes TaxID=110365 RepID=A0A023B5G1_GRENI|nr:lecithin:cholesterol acyltransferase [Gregarina niphandrodes]EZG60709.1 lecithin:cholesterol acyltransferase [Gregarina niphandrodes]|eukprot:XP_011130818.1 lecithin:cholesterol acyltransferase [Gregarina niphandrodes]